MEPILTPAIPNKLPPQRWYISGEALILDMTTWATTQGFVFDPPRRRIDESFQRCFGKHTAELYESVPFLSHAISNSLKENFPVLTPSIRPPCMISS